MVLKFKKMPNFEEPLSKDDKRLSGATLVIRSDARATSEQAWSKAKDKKGDQVINGLKYTNIRNERAIVGWRGLTIGMLGALRVPSAAFEAEQGASPSDEVEFDETKLGWLMGNCPDRLANRAVRRAYGEDDEEPVTADEEGDRKKS
jgi:hypothetical protein